MTLTVLNLFWVQTETELPYEINQPLLWQLDFNSTKKVKFTKNKQHGDHIRCDLILHTLLIIYELKTIKSIDFNFVNS